MQSKELQKLQAENEELLKRLASGSMAKKYKAAQNVLMKNLNQDGGGQEGQSQFSQLNAELHDQAIQDVDGPPVRAS